MSSATVCTPEEYALSLPSAGNPDPPIYCLSRGQSIGLALTAESGFISVAAVLLLFLLLVRNVVRYNRLAPGGNWRLLKEPTDIYMLSLFCMDLVQALGAVLDVKWVREGKVYDGSFCTTQEKEYWCWVGERYRSERIAGEYLWLWTALFSSVLMYVPLYFWTQGFLSVDPHTWWRFRVHRRSASPGSPRALGMLAYPAVYSVLVLPLSIVRWITFRTGSAPSAATFVVIFLFSLSGACNVLLLLTTRPQLLLFTPPRPPTGARLPSPVRSRGMKDDDRTVRLGRLEEDSEWNLPESDRASAMSTFVSSDVEPPGGGNKVTAEV
ncbi:hypothetical protein BV25DRAFT_1840948 [Artomyces pyxidatus]|uniref:Uncharacterized protein n=1 Tax=Artomyces pyxidatus TaxID=48021 RepID=A0ACB8SQD5_9AGAM|nr:hypothetical protein BV25DRAFT_1840948 [Artomyces pyxidatus]